MVGVRVFQASCVAVGGGTTFCLPATATTVGDAAVGEAGAVVAREPAVASVVAVRGVVAVARGVVAAVWLVEARLFTDLLLVAALVRGVVLRNVFTFGAVLGDVVASRVVLWNVFTLGAVLRNVVAGGVVLGDVFALRYRGVARFVRFAVASRVVARLFAVARLAIARGTTRTIVAEAWGVVAVALA